MIDIKFLRENPDIVKENIKKKFQDHKLPLVDEVIEQSEEIGIRADEISSANKEIKQFEIEFSQQQQSQPNIGIGIGE